MLGRGRRRVNCVTGTHRRFWVYTSTGNYRDHRVIPETILEELDAADNH